MSSMKLTSHLEVVQVDDSLAAALRKGDAKRRSVGRPGDPLGQDAMCEGGGRTWHGEQRAGVPRREEVDTAQSRADQHQGLVGRVKLGGGCHGVQLQPHGWRGWQAVGCVGLDGPGRGVGLELCQLAGRGLQPERHTKQCDRAVAYHYIYVLYKAYMIHKSQHTTSENNFTRQ
eukprot:scaffold100924_cov40-Prasinocladus_malaysianus.AAC.1